MNDPAILFGVAEGHLLLASLCARKYPRLSRRYITQAGDVLAERSRLAGDKMPAALKWGSRTWNRVVGRAQGRR